MGLGAALGCSPPNLEQPHSDTSLPAGCELSSEQDSYTFQVPEEWQCEQQLALRTVGGPCVPPPPPKNPQESQARDAWVLWGVTGGGVGMFFSFPKDLPGRDGSG